MNIQTNKRQILSQFDILIASSVILNTMVKLENLAPKLNTNYFEVQKFVEGNIFKGLKSKIEGFSNLQHNWDSYNADVISKNAINAAIETLNHLNSKGQLTNGFAVNVFPMRDCGIQFEFDGENICAELEINHIGELTFILFDNDGNIEQDPLKLFELTELSTLLEEAQYVL